MSLDWMIKINNMNCIGMEIDLNVYNAYYVRNIQKSPGLVNLKTRLVSIIATFLHKHGQHIPSIVPRFFTDRVKLANKIHYHFIHGTCCLTQQLIRAPLLSQLYQLTYRGTRQAGRPAGGLQSYWATSLKLGSVVSGCFSFIVSVCARCTSHTRMHTLERI